jgi:aerobic-type carbon monoxide dehydrogenase small subunit (CoxS/CutS family)
VDVTFVLNGTVVVVSDDSRGSLLDALRGVGVKSVKDACAPQGQCGCCTVWVEGASRLACVTPLRRVAGKEVTTLEGLDEESVDSWAAAMVLEGGSQCGFCTPGIVMRLESTGRGGGTDDASVSRALGAHVCRCTGWQGIRRAASARFSDRPLSCDEVDLEGASRRATLEGGVRQDVSTSVALGGAGFAADTAPEESLVAVLGGDGQWVLAESMAEARLLAGRSPSRRRGGEGALPLRAPEGDWDAELVTRWVEPAYLETDASWCNPGGEPWPVLANGGAFGAKARSPLPEVARRLADEAGRPVLALYSRQDSVRLAPKRPPIAAGLRRDGSGTVRVVACEGIEDAIRSALPGVDVDLVEVQGPGASAELRGAGWVEGFCLALAAGADTPLGTRDGEAVVVDLAPGGRARVSIGDEGVDVEVAAGEVLSEAVLRSYVEGAVHMALGLVTSESLAVAEDGTVEEDTMRSFGVLTAAEMPEVGVRILDDDGPAVPVADAVFAATAAAAWLRAGAPPRWPTGGTAID